MSAAKAALALTAPVEDYLKVVYELQRSGDPAGTNEIATMLRIAPASVSGMMRRLAEQGLIAHEPYRGARLTLLKRADARRCAPSAGIACSKNISPTRWATRGIACTMKPSNSNTRRPMNWSIRMAAAIRRAGHRSTRCAHPAARWHDG